MRAKKSRRTILPLTLGLVLAVLAVWFLCAGPVLVKSIGPLPAVWNPIRNRSSEHYAKVLLTEIQSDNCQQALAPLNISDEDKSSACDKQQRGPVRAECQLVERIDDAPTVWLLFRCPYKKPLEARADISVTLEQVGDRWLLRAYERIN